MKSKIHALAGALALLVICSFWLSTIISELFASDEQIAFVKLAILRGMLVLVPALAIVGASGMALGGKWKGALIASKKRRMKFAAANGIFILVPSAFFLAGRAQAMNFDMAFIAVQGLEMLAGAINIALLALNMKDGIAITRRKSRP